MAGPDERLSPEDLERFGRGDEAAFARVYDGYASDVRALAARCFPSPFEQEQAVMAAWIVVYRTRRLRGAAPLGRWLLEVASRCFQERLRDSGRHAPVDLDRPYEPRTPAGSAARLKEAVRAFAERLPYDERKMVELGLMRQLPDADVARALATSASRCRALRQAVLEKAAADPHVASALDALRGGGG